MLASEDDMECHLAVAGGRHICYCMQGLLCVVWAGGYRLPYCEFLIHMICLCRSLTAAVSCCAALQKQLLELDWPAEVLRWESCMEQRDTDGNLIWRGLRVRMGMAFGRPQVKLPLNTGLLRTPVPLRLKYCLFLQNVKVICVP